MMGGDEFAIIAGSTSDRHAATLLAQRIIDAFAVPFQVEGQEVVSTASVGVALAPFHGDNPRDLLKNADTALYRAKRTRASFEMFEPKDGAEAREGKALERDLRSALANDELHLLYQPLLDLASDRVVGCEALLRWDHPVRGSVPPSIFIPIAERTGQIRAIGEWVIEEACRTAAAWPSSVRVSVNFSPVQFRERRIL